MGWKVENASSSTTGGADSGTGEGHLLAGRYRLGDVLGSGGMGRVWRARDEVLHRTVAVKELRAGLYAAEADRAVLHARTQKEARAAARINHPGVVTVHDVLHHDDRPWIVMEYVDGPSMADALKETGSFDPREAARIGLHVLGALHAAHAVGVLHRDVKPGNVMLARDGRVLLTDFGIAAIEGDSTITRTGELVGSIDYLAPERIRGEDPGPASDLWALGATLYTAVEERSPFRRTSPIGTLQAVIAEEPEPSYHAGALGPVIVALLRKEAGDRPGAEQTRRMLREVMEGRPSPQAQAHVPTRQVSEAQLRASAPVVPTRPMDPRSPAGVTQGHALQHPTADGRTPGHDPATAQVAAGGQPPAGGGTQAGPRGRRRGRAVLSVLAAAVIGGGAAFGVIQYMDNDDPHKGSLPQTSAGQGGATGGEGGTAKPDPGKSGDQKNPDNLPAGWHRVKENGFSLPVPDGWKGGMNKPGQYDYTRDNGRHRIRINVDTSPDFNSPYAHLVDLERAISKTLPEFQRDRLEQGTYRDRQSGRLDFSYREKTDNPGPRFAVDHMHFAGRNGPEYAIYVAGPLADKAKTLERFDVVLRGWQYED
ncbi:serine/threonine-protein kinase [Streptomyces sp. NPDC004111]|uniref:serine/threonine-protein kinase n=1 Tax=Streptomyces sp. NPDC004111 TaxID=3364690 RepID=UPI0036CACCDB